MKRSGIHPLAALGAAAVLALARRPRPRPRRRGGRRIGIAHQEPAGRRRPRLDRQPLYARLLRTPWVAAVGKDAKKADVPALEVKAREIFGKFAISMGADPKGMQVPPEADPRPDRRKIAQEDPHVLDTYDSFTEADGGRSRGGAG